MLSRERQVSTKCCNGKKIACNWELSSNNALGGSRRLNRELAIAQIHKAYRVQWDSTEQWFYTYRVWETLFLTKICFIVHNQKLSDIQEINVTDKNEDSSVILHKLSFQMIINMCGYVPDILTLILWYRILLFSTLNFVFWKIILTFFSYQSKAYLL